LDNADENTKVPLADGELGSDESVFYLVESVEDGSYAEVKKFRGDEDFVVYVANVLEFFHFWGWGDGEGNCREYREC